LTKKLGAVRRTDDWGSTVMDIACRGYRHVHRHP